MTREILAPTAPQHHVQRLPLHRNPPGAAGRNAGCARRQGRTGPIDRKGAIYMTNSQNITVTNSSFDQLGGNGVFVDNYADRDTVSDNSFTGDGETDVQVVGSPTAVRRLLERLTTTRSRSTTLAADRRTTTTHVRSISRTT